MQNVYVADTGEDTVRVVIAGGGVTTIAAGDLQEPSGITGDRRGNVFMSDTDGARVLKIGPSRTVTTGLGNGVPGYNGTYTSDPVTHQPTEPKLGTTAKINSQRGLATDLAGQLFVAEAGNGIVRRLDPSGHISLTAGKTINGERAGRMTCGHCVTKGWWGCAPSARPNSSGHTVRLASSAPGLHQERSASSQLHDRIEGCALSQTPERIGQWRDRSGAHADQVGSRGHGVCVLGHGDGIR